MHQQERLFLYSLILPLLILGAAWKHVHAEYMKRQQLPPNIILIVADDLGYGELGAYGQTFIETPNLDALAASGMRFTQFYSGSAVCAPARSVLLTGKHSGHTYIRGNDEFGERGEVWNFAKAAHDPLLEGQRPLPANTFTLGKVLQKAGYQTACIGKWGLGAPTTEGRPNLQGFDFFYGYNCQRQAHILYPPFQWQNEEKIPLNNALVPPGTKLPPDLPMDQEESYSLFSGRDYAPDLQAKAAIEFLSGSTKPFFLYFASPLPHVALQAREPWVSYYRNKLGPEAPYLGQQGYLPSIAPMATYAAMISILDEQVGAIMKWVKEQGIERNTIIVFTSDNGPSFAGGVDPEKFKSAGPFQAQYGRGKGFLYEGGIRVPLLVSWPGVVKPASKSEHLAAFEDFFPTFCEAARITLVPDDLDGKSFLQVLKGKRKYSVRPYLYWEIPEYGGQQAVRKGHWKAIRQDLQKDLTPVKLYNLETDPLEQHDLAVQYPEIVLEMEQIMTKEHVPSPVAKFKIKALDSQ